ncbi:hypothetical protein N7526_000001 [Penicillium atrosanguineum]|nr:hypothetical protein N7526_008630 [Penicillium atrosanguineum]KAJ5146649.1 hypothetical protein N7526_000001 [Penicillium atrosanguineum]
MPKTIAWPYDSPPPNMNINHAPPPAHPAYKSNIARAIVAPRPPKLPALVNPVAPADGAYAGIPHDGYLVAGTRVESVTESGGTRYRPRVHWQRGSGSAGSYGRPGMEHARTYGISRTHPNLERPDWGVVRVVGWGLGSAV